MNTSRLTAAALAALALAGSAPAADVKIYGRADTGLIYQNYFGDSTKDDSFAMQSGTSTATRVGIEGLEAISDDISVGFRLENRFASDTGELKGDRLFEGNASVKVISKTFGEVAAGRISGIGSGSGPYDLQNCMDAFGGGTNGTGLSPLKSSRMDNTITYRSPKFSGFQATLQHSLKMDSVSASSLGEESESSANRFYGVGLHYTAGPLDTALVYEQTDWGKANANNTPDDDKIIVTLGGSYRFDDLRLFAQAQYFNGVEAFDGFSTTGANAMTGLKGYGLYAGAEFRFGNDSLQTMAYWHDYKTDVKDTGDSVDGSSAGIATKYLYRPSKTVEMYVGCGYSQWDRLDAGAVKTDKSVNAYSGVTKYF